jgi:hypothetical protein
MLCVDLFYIPDFYQHLGYQTNLYASHAVHATPDPFTECSLYQTWVPMTVEEMKKFLGVTFIIGIIKKPKLKMYWTDDPFFLSHQFSFSKTMPCN